MRCHVHPQSPAVATCVRCGNFVCAVCDVEMGGQHFCKTCLRDAGRRTPAGLRRFARTRRDRWVAGVCGGIARYFGIDPTLVRVLFILGMIFTAVVPFVVTYIVLTLVTPVEEEW